MGKVLLTILMIMLVFTLESCFSQKCTSKYHKLANKNSSINFEHNGIIIGIEKYDHDCAKHKEGVDKKRYQVSKVTKKNKEKFKEVVIKNQDKVMLVSHIIEFKNCLEDDLKNCKRNDIYNPFSKNKIPEYKQGYFELDKLSSKLKNILENGKYTHLVFISMGWNNNEKESIKRYNSIVRNIMEFSKNKKIKPYIVAITWPSTWKIKYFSFVNKANDADEMGFTIVNYILHNVLLNSVKDMKDIKVVAIGHSFGARVISRAIFSKDFLKENKAKARELDLFIGLQPAFSVYRFIPKKGEEGSPYKTYNKMKTKFLITSSSNDKANSKATWSKYIGCKRAFPIVKKHPNIFNFHKSQIVKFDKLWQKPLKIEYIDASNFITGHNDILDCEMGRFLFKIINSLDNTTIQGNKRDKQKEKSK